MRTLLTEFLERWSVLGVGRICQMIDDSTVQILKQTLVAIRHSNIDGIDLSPLHLAYTTSFFFFNLFQPLGTSFSRQSLIKAQSL